MLFNVYLITVLISVGINLSSFAHVFFKLKKYGYKFEKFFIGDSAKGVSFGIILGMVMVPLTAALSLIPIFNVITNIVTLNNWTYSVNHIISFLQSNDIVYNKYSCFIDEIERNKSLFKTKKILYKNNDIVSQEMVEAMYLDGASKSKIKWELMKSKKSRLEYLKEISNLLKLYKFSLGDIELTMQAIDVNDRLEMVYRKIKRK